MFFHNKFVGDIPICSLNDSVACMWPEWGIFLHSLVFLLKIKKVFLCKRFESYLLSLIYYKLLACYKLSEVINYWLVTHCSK